MASFALTPFGSLTSSRPVTVEYLATVLAPRPRWAELFTVGETPGANRTRTSSGTCFGAAPPWTPAALPEPSPRSPAPAAGAMQISRPTKTTRAMASRRDVCMIRSSLKRATSRLPRPLPLATGGGANSVPDTRQETVLLDQRVSTIRLPATEQGSCRHPQTFSHSALRRRRGEGRPRCLPLPRREGHKLLDFARLLSQEPLEVMGPD